MPQASDTCVGLGSEISKYRLFRERLIAAYPDVPDDALRDTLEGITDLQEMIAEVIRSALVDEAMVAGLKSRIDEMKARLSRLEVRASKKRRLALEAMIEVDLKKLTQPDFTVSRRPGPHSLVVVCEDTIPETYWIPRQPRLDRQSLIAALKLGRDIPGVKLNKPQPTLSVRTK